MSGKERDSKRRGKEPDHGATDSREHPALSRSEQRLVETEQWLSLAVHSANVGLWKWELGSDIVTFSSEWKEQLGYADHDVPHRYADMESRIHPDDLARVRSGIAAYLQDPSSRLHLEVRMRHEDGSYRWLLAQASLLRDENGTPTHLLGANIDITQRKRDEERLRASEDRFVQAFLRSPAGLSISRLADGKFLEVNDVFLDLVGFSRAEVIGSTATELGLLSPEERGVLLQGRMGHGGLRLAEVTLHGASGTPVHLLVSSNLAAIDGEDCLIATMIDLTSRKEAEDRVRLQSAALAAAANAIVIAGPDGTIEWVNPAFSALTGYDESDVVGRTPRILKSGMHDKAFYTSLWDTIRRGDVWRGEMINRRKDGNLYTEEQTITPVIGPAGVIAKYIAIKQDVTARKEAEARIARQLRQLHALRTIDMAITSTLDLRVTLDVVLDHVCAQLGVDACCLLLFSPSAVSLDVVAARGLPSLRGRDRHLRLGEGLCGRVGIERRTIVVPDIRQAGDDQLDALELVRDGFVGHAGVPLIAKGVLKGVLGVYHRAPLHPDAEWLEFLETLAGQAAIAIDDARLVEDLLRSNAELLVAYDATIEGWSRAMDLRDRETEGHTQRVTDMVMRMGRLAGMDDGRLVHVRRGALLHDMGKLGVPDSILWKAGDLTPEEWLLMKQHPRYAYDMLSPITFLRPALDIPYCHHEKWNGTGYPRGLRGEQIPEAARLFAVVDVWDALSSDRPYRPAWPKERVRAHIVAQSGTAFDPRAVELFSRLLDEDSGS